MMEEETSKRPCHTNDPVYAPAHYAGDGKIECKAAMGSMSVLRSIEYVTPHERGIAWQRNSTR